MRKRRGVWERTGIDRKDRGVKGKGKKEPSLLDPPHNILDPALALAVTVITSVEIESIFLTHLLIRLAWPLN